MARLVIEGGPGAGRGFDLGERTVLGRGPDCQVRIEDGGASLRHAELRREPDGVYVRDLRSTNGTWVADVRITTPRRLRDGERVRVGGTTFRFEEGGWDGVRAAEFGGIQRQRAPATFRPTRGEKRSAIGTIGTPLTRAEGGLGTILLIALGLGAAVALLLAIGRAI